MGTPREFEGWVDVDGDQGGPGHDPSRLSRPALSALGLQLPPGIGDGIVSPSRRITELLKEKPPFASGTGACIGPELVEIVAELQDAYASAAKAVLSDPLSRPDTAAPEPTGGHPVAQLHGIAARLRGSRHPSARQLRLLKPVENLLLKIAKLDQAKIALQHYISAMVALKECVSGLGALPTALQQVAELIASDPALGQVAVESVLSLA